VTNDMFRLNLPQLGFNGTAKKTFSQLTKITP
jgi:hypothetical protein